MISSEHKFQDWGVRFQMVHFKPVDLTINEKGIAGLFCINLLNFFKFPFLSLQHKCQSLLQVRARLEITNFSRENDGYFIHP